MTESTPPNIQTLKKRTGPKCHTCGAGLKTGPRLVVKGHWTCPSCVYELEYGEAEKAKRRRRTGPPQEERLFPLPEPTADVSRRP